MDRETIDKQRQLLLKLIRRHIDELESRELDLLLDLVKRLQQEEKKQIELGVEKTCNAVKLNTGLTVSVSGNIKETKVSAQNFEPLPSSTGCHSEPGSGESPEQVVEKFVQCWNEQDFRSEYKYLAKELRIYPVEEYIASRRLTFYETIKRSKSRSCGVQQIKQIISNKVNNDQAIVECYKVEHASPEEKETIYYQRYTLKKEDNQWKIANVSSRLKQS